MPAPAEASGRFTPVFAGYGWNPVFRPKMRQCALSGRAPRRACSRQIDRAVVPVDRVDADHPLAAIKQGSEHPADSHIAELAHRIAARHGGVAHGIETLGQLDDL